MCVKWTKQSSWQISKECHYQIRTISNEAYIGSAFFLTTSADFHQWIDWYVLHYVQCNDWNIALPQSWFFGLIRMRSNYYKHSDEPNKPEILFYHFSFVSLECFAISVHNMFFRLQLFVTKSPVFWRLIWPWIHWLIDWITFSDFLRCNFLLLKFHAVMAILGSIFGFHFDTICRWIIEGHQGESQWTSCLKNIITQVEGTRKHGMTVKLGAWCVNSHQCNTR